jgi:hypothetical protein
LGIFVTITPSPGEYPIPVYYYYYYCMQVANEMGGACGAYGGGERCAQGVGGKARGKEAIGETKTKMGG